MYASGEVWIYENTIYVWYNVLNGVVYISWTYHNNAVCLWLTVSCCFYINMYLFLAVHTCNMIVLIDTWYGWRYVNFFLICGFVLYRNAVLFVCAKSPGLVASMQVISMLRTMLSHKYYSWPIICLSTLRIVNCYIFFCQCFLSLCMYLLVT